MEFWLSKDAPTDVASKEDGHSGFNHLDHHRFHVLNLGVDIWSEHGYFRASIRRNRLTQDGAATEDIAQLVDGVQLGIFVTRVVDEREGVSR